MIPALFAQIGLPVLIEIAKQGLEKLDNPVAKKASRALKDVEDAVQKGKISEEELVLVQKHIENMRHFDQMEFETLIKEVNQSLRTEAMSQDLYVRRMRPTFGYIMALTWAAQMLSLAYVMVEDPAGSVVVISAMESLGTIWTVGLSVLGIYVYKRSQEKDKSSEPVEQIMQRLLKLKEKLNK